MMASKKIECLVTVKGETVKMETEIPDDVGTYRLVASEQRLWVSHIDGKKVAHAEIDLDEAIAKKDR